MAAYPDAMQDYHTEAISTQGHNVGGSQLRSPVSRLDARVPESSLAPCGLHGLQARHFHPMSVLDTQYSSITTKDNLVTPTWWNGGVGSQTVRDPHWIVIRLALYRSTLGM